MSPLDNLRLVRSTTLYDYSAQSSTVVTVTPEDLSNEIDETACAAVMAALDRGQFELAGRVIEAIRSALLQRYIALAHGERPDPRFDMEAAIKSAVPGLEVSDSDFGAFLDAQVTA